MKFLCPNCRAKYQIADERVAGRSVKIKCRKCGHIIRISKPAGDGAAEGSVPPPSGSVTSDRAPAPSSLPAPRPPPRDRPSSSPPPGPEEERADTAGENAAEAGSPLPAEVKRRPEIHAKLPSRLERGKSQTDAAGSDSAPSSGAAPQSLEEAARALTAANSADVASASDAGGALVGAFAQAVSAADSSVGDALTSGGVGDWYVGINNVPVGPIRMSQLHSKAAVGAVGPDSLVWREGFEDWQPLSTFPELLAVVEDAQASASSESLAATTGVGGASAAAVHAVAATGDGGVAASATGGAAALDESIAGISRRGGPKAAWLAVVVALVFGLTVGFVMFGGKQTAQTVVKYVEVPAEKKQGAVEETQAGASEESTEPGTDETEKQSAVKGTRRVAKGGTATAAEAKKEKASGGGLKGLKSLGGVRSGPNAPTGKSEAATGGQPLDSARLQRTVARYTGSVKRSCWQPALSARKKDAPLTARVSVSIKVAPAGNVQSASSSGDPKGYPGLARCITSRVRAWRFPASSGQTTVNVPFVFAAQ